MAWDLFSAISSRAYALSATTLFLTEVIQNNPSPLIIFSKTQAHRKFPPLKVNIHYLQIEAANGECPWYSYIEIICVARLTCRHIYLYTMYDYEPLQK